MAHRMNSASLPPIAIRLLEHVLPHQDRDAVVGDLIEEVALRAHGASRTTTDWWLLGQIVRSVPRVLWSKPRTRDGVVTLGVAGAAYIGASAIESLSVVVIAKTFGPDALLST